MPSTHKVARGDTLISIAKQHGFCDWKTIYFHDSNAALREKRTDPMILQPDDEVQVPDKVPAEFKVETNKRHSFTLKTLRASLELSLEDADGVPYGDKEFSLAIEGGPTIEGVTDPEGNLDVEVPPDAKSAKLTLYTVCGDRSTSMSWPIDLGHLNPIEELDGVRGRLQNLGYDAGDPGANDAEKLASALRAFQEDQALTVTGERDGPTLARLEELSS